MATQHNQPNEQAVFLQSGDARTENRVPDSYSTGQLGQHLWQKDPTDGRDKKHQLVQVDSTMDVVPSPGAIAWWADRDTYSVTTDSSAAGRGNVAGMFHVTMTAAELLARHIVCIQKRGFASVQVDTGTPTAAGLFVIPSATDAKADVLAAGTASSYPRIGKTLSVAAAGLFDCDLNVDDGND